MIDLHCHMLPGIDDGAPDLDTALQMAKAAVADGITVTACTPHIYPGLFDNTVASIEAALAGFREQLQDAGIPLELTLGADIQIVPDLVEGLQSRRLPTLGGTRYFLFEPPHHIAPPGMDELLHNVLMSGYVPIITHPERLTYIEERYQQFARAVEMGAWIQVTGGAVTGRFGSRVQKIAHRFLADGLTHLLATDAHNLENRPPLLAEARAAAAALVGAEEAQRLVETRPRAVLENLAPEAVDAISVQPPPGRGRSERRWWQRLFG